MAHKSTKYPFSEIQFGFSHLVFQKTLRLIMKYASGSAFMKSCEQGLVVPPDKFLVLQYLLAC